MLIGDYASQGSEISGANSSLRESLRGAKTPRRWQSRSTIRERARPGANKSINGYNPTRSELDKGKMGPLLNEKKGNTAD